MREPPPRDPRHNLDEWNHEQDVAARQVERDRADAARRTRDVYAVADRVLAPMMERTPSAVPRGTLAKCTRAIVDRGERVTRAALLLEAARRAAQERAGKDPELALALTLRAAHLFSFDAGDRPRPDRRRDFGSVCALLAAAFSDWELGLGPAPRDDSAARGEAFVDRRVDAQALVYRSQVDLALLPLLFERHVLGRYRSRCALSDELRLREYHKLSGDAIPWSDLARCVARSRLPAEPEPPGSDRTEAERGAHRLALREWREEVARAVWGDAPARDKELLRAVEDAEYALRLALGASPDRGRTIAQKSRPA